MISISGSSQCCRVEASEVEKAGQGFVLKGQPDIQVTSRAFKMSKSRGNVVNPDDIVFSFGADSLRLYEMFMGPLRETKVGPTSGPCLLAHCSLGLYKCNVVLCSLSNLI